mgnify:CR=1 FL=1
MELRLDREDAINKARQIRGLADEMQKNLTSSQETMEYINSIFTGSNSAVIAKEAFGEIISDFPAFYKQVTKFADDLESTANIVKNEG